MPSLNKALIMGHLGRDPELKYIPSGSAVCTFSVATTRKWKGKGGDKNEDTQWHNIKVWGKQAEVASQYLKKGSGVFIIGRIETREYEKDGQKKWFTEIVAEDLQLMGKPTTDGAGKAQESPAQTSGDDLPF